MNWNQIETNWAAMTRRVRPDLTCATQTRPATLQQDAVSVGPVGETNQEPALTEVPELASASLGGE